MKKFIVVNGAPGTGTQERGRLLAKKIIKNGDTALIAPAALFKKQSWLGMRSTNPEGLDSHKTWEAIALTTIVAFEHRENIVMAYSFNSTAIIGYMAHNAGLLDYDMDYVLVDSDPLDYKRLGALAKKENSFLNSDSVLLWNHVNDRGAIEIELRKCYDRGTRERNVGKEVWS